MTNKLIIALTFISSTIFGEVTDANNKTYAFVYDQLEYTQKKMSQHQDPYELMYLLGKCDAYNDVRVFIEEND